MHILHIYWLPSSYFTLPKKHDDQKVLKKITWISSNTSSLHALLFFSKGLILAFFSSNFFQAPQDTKPNYVEPRLLFPILQGKLDKWHQNKTWTCHKPCRSLMWKSREKETTWNAKCPISLGNFTPKTSNYCLKNRALGFPGTTKKTANDQKTQWSPQHLRSPQVRPIFDPTRKILVHQTATGSEAEGFVSSQASGEPLLQGTQLAKRGRFVVRILSEFRKHQKMYFLSSINIPVPNKKPFRFLLQTCHIYLYIYIYQGECVCKVAKRCGWRLSILSQY